MSEAETTQVQPTGRQQVLRFVAANQWVVLLALTIVLGLITGLVNCRAPLGRWLPGGAFCAVGNAKRVAICVSPNDSTSVLPAATCS